MEFEDARDADDAFYEMKIQSIFCRRNTFKHAKGVPRSRNFYNYKGVTHKGAAEVLMASKEKAIVK